MPTRRAVVKVGALMGVGGFAAAGGALVIPRFFQSSNASQTPLLGSKIPKFVDPLSTFVGTRVTSTSFDVQMGEFQQKILPNSLYSGLSQQSVAGTYLWGYKVGDKPFSYPGHTVEAQRGKPTTITYFNKIPLPSASKLQAYLTIDQTLHWGDPRGHHHTDSTQAYQGSIPTSVHLHGAEVSSSFDGGPEQWFTSDGLHGKGYATSVTAAANAAIYSYPNSQPATTLWFHDHTLGLTRLNIFSGLAAFYLVRDQYDTGRTDNPLGLPAGPQEVELIIQDRQFDTDGQLMFLNDTPPNPSIHPHWMPEFFGDTIVVNGKTWPYFDVEPRRYRFRIVNGSNARFYRMSLTDSANKAAVPAFWQIGTDGGLLNAPVKLNDAQNASPLPLTLGPAERADIIIDFAGHAGRTFTLVNDAPTPFPGGNAPDPASSGSIMQFRVRLPLSGKDITYDPASGASLRGGSNQDAALTRLVDVGAGTLAAGVTPLVKRQLVLVEISGPNGPVGALLNNTTWTGSKGGSSQPVDGAQPDKSGQGIHLTELPKVGSTEVWEIINLTEDAHPLHIHLVQFQLINRQKFNREKYRTKYDSLFPGGTYKGVTPQKTWGDIAYKSGEYIPSYGPPLSYSSPNESGAVGGNPDVAPFLEDAKILPDGNEAGWKDTLKVFPDQVTRIAILWAPIATPIDGVVPGQNLYSFDPTTGPGYAWHCHILDHEDNEMMRPYAPVM